MDKVIQKLRALRRRGRQQTPVRGTPPRVNLTHNPMLWQGFWIFLGTALLVFIGGTLALLWMQNMAVLSAAYRALSYALVSGAVVALLYYLLPLLRVLSFMVWHQQRPPRHILAHFSGGQKFVCLGLIAAGLLYNNTASGGGAVSDSVAPWSPGWRGVSDSVAPLINDRVAHE